VFKVKILYHLSPGEQDFIQELLQLVLGSCCQCGGPVGLNCLILWKVLYGLCVVVIVVCLYTINLLSQAWWRLRPPQQHRADRPSIYARTMYLVHLTVDCHPIGLEESASLVSWPCGQRLATALPLSRCLTEVSFCSVVGRGLLWGLGEEFDSRACRDKVTCACLCAERCTGQTLDFFFWWDWDLNSRFCVCKAGVLLLELHHQSILLWLFWRWNLMNYFLGLALNLDPLYFSLLSS
jgi:hypothetical protein